MFWRPGNEHGPTQSFDHALLALQLGADGREDLADVRPRHDTLGFSKGTTHACLGPVGPGTGQCLSDAVTWKGCESHPCRNSSPCTRCKCSGLGGFRVGTHPPSPFSDPGQRCGIRITSAETRLWVRLVLPTPIQRARRLPVVTAGNICLMLNRT
jgi:hypothetical protein